MNDKMIKIHKAKLIKLIALLLCLSVFLAGCSINKATAGEMGKDSDDWINVGDIKDETPPTSSSETNDIFGTTTAQTKQTMTDVRDDTTKAIPTNAPPSASPVAEGTSAQSPSITPFTITNPLVITIDVSGKIINLPPEVTGGVALDDTSVDLSAITTTPPTTYGGIQINGLIGTTTTFSISNATAVAINTITGSRLILNNTAGDLLIDGNNLGDNLTVANSGGTVNIGTHTISATSGTFSGTGTITAKGNIDVSGGVNITSGAPSVTLTGTTTGTVTANAGHTVTLPTTGTWNVDGTGSINVGASSTATINASSTGILNITGSSTGQINGGTGTIKLPTAGNFNIAGGTFDLSGTSGIITLAGNTNIKGGTNTATGEIVATAPNTATITDNGSYRIKGNVAIGATFNPTIIATGDVIVTGEKATIKATGNHELDLSGMTPAADGDIIVDYVDSTNAPKIKLPTNGNAITIKNATTIQVDLTTTGPINLNIDSTASVIVDFINGDASDAVITSLNLTNLTIKSATTGKTIAGTVNVKGAVALTDLTVENTATGLIIVDAPPSTPTPTPTASPFTNLTVKGALTDLQVLVNGNTGGGIDTANPQRNIAGTFADVVPQFEKIDVTGASLLKKIDITGCGVETDFLVEGWSNAVASKDIVLSGNGFRNDVYKDWLKNIRNVGTIIMANCPSSYRPFSNPNAVDSLPVVSITIDTSITNILLPNLGGNSALTKIDLGSSSYVKEVTFNNGENVSAANSVATAVAIFGHDGLTVNISGDSTKHYKTVNSISKLILKNNEYTAWPDTKMAVGGQVINELYIENASSIMLASIDFSSATNSNAKKITLKSKLASATVDYTLADVTEEFVLDDLTQSNTTELTIKGTSSSSSQLKSVDVAGNSTGREIKKLTYKDIALNTAPGGTDTAPTGGLPKVKGWGNDNTNKELILDTISLTHLGTFYGENTTSGHYLSTRGYTKLGILDLKGTAATSMKMKYLNIRDQAGSIHTLKFDDKSDLVTYNLNGCSLLVNGTAALTEVFNVSNNILTHVDYSGCTQLEYDNASLGKDTLQLHNNKIIVAYMDITTSGIRNINLSGNKLATATSVAFTGSIGASGDTGLCLGATVFHNTDSVLNISSNIFNKIDFSRDLAVVNIAISQGNGAGGTITNGVTVINQTALKNINLSSNTVKTKLDLSKNPNLENLWGTTNNHTAYPTATTDMAATPGTPNNMVTNTVDSLNIHGELNLEESYSLYGTDGGKRFLEFNNVSNKNEHEITIANLNKTSAENVQINYNGTLTTLILTERVDATSGAAPGSPVLNLEVVGNVIKNVYTGAGTTGLMLPSNKANLSNHVRIDTNPLDSVVIDGYNDVTFVGLSNTTAPLELVPPAVAQGTPAGNIKHRISGGVTIINSVKLEIVDITNNEIFKLNLSNNAMLNSILGTLSVTTGTAVPTIGGTSALNGAIALPAPNTVGVKDASMVDEEINLSKSANLNDKMIFNGHHIKKAYLGENDFELVDLRRNDGKGESASENDSPSYRDKNDEFRGILEFVDISNNTPGKEIGDLFLDENKLKIIDSTATAEAGTSVLMTNTKFKPSSFLTANKNDIEKVVIKPGNGTNVESSMKEIQLNDNNMKILHAIDMKVLELIKVNRTVYGKNDFVDGSVILKGSDKLKEFAPATVVEEDKAVNDNISRRRPSRPNESYWSVDRAFNDASVNFSLTHIPLDSFADLGGTANKPIAVQYKDAFVPAVNNTGYYHYVPVAELDISGCTNLVTLRVAGNYLTDGRMNLGGTTTPNIEFLDISGKHDIAENSENGKYMVPGERMTQEDYLYGSLFASSGYRDGKSGQLGKSVGAFVSQWPKAEHIRIENNSYSSFNVAASAGIVKTVLAFNNNMTSVEVSAASQLQVLDVERNAIAPTILLPTQNLLILRAGHNLISDYPNTHQVPGLQELYLDNNNFPEKSISRATTGNPNLKVINLSNNRFRAFEDFTSNLKLEEIYLFNNDTANLPKVALNGNVKVLDVHQNKIENIRDDELPNSLRYFDISDNKLQKFTLTKIPAGMASMDNIITAHEVIPSHMSDPSMPYFHGDRRGFIGTLNISNNQLSYITDEYDVAWAAFDANSPTGVMRFLLDYNLLDIDKYDKSKPEYLKGRQKWLTSTKEGCIKFILTVTPEDRRVRLVRYLAYGHPLRGTSEKAPGNATYDIWFDNEIEYGPDYIEQAERGIYQTIEYINMYAAVSTPDTRPKYPMRYGSDISSIINSSEQKNAVTPGKYADKNVARNNVAVVKACLYGPNTDLLPWEDVFGSKFKGTTDGKDATLSDGRYNPVTGPKN